MNKEQKKAFEAGKTFSPESEQQNAPCYDARFGKDFRANATNIIAWWEGRAVSGSDVPKWMKTRRLGDIK